MRGGLALVAVPLALLAAGCGQGGSGVARPSQEPDFAERAAAVAETWRASGVSAAWRRGFVPLQDLTVLSPDASFTDDTKQAYLAGWFRSTARLSTEVPADGAVRFARGDTLSVPLVSAAEAYRAIDKGDPPCPGRTNGPPAVGTAGPDAATGTTLPGQCTALTVTGVKLGTVQLRTSRGDATVPAWLFTVDELAQTVARVAVAPAAIAAVPSPSPLPPHPDASLVGAQDLAKVDGARLTYRLLVGACDKDITPLVYEADDVVVVGGRVTHTGEVCILVAKLEPVTVDLRAPLDERPVLDATNGQPLIVR